MSKILTVPNLDREQKQNPPLGEAVQQIQTYINKAVSGPTGNRKSPPTFVTPAQRPG